MSGSLFSRERVCEICRDRAPYNSKTFKADQPVILAINVTIYRRTRRGRQLATSKRVQICERCAVRAVGSPIASTEEGLSFGESLFARIGDLYRRMVDLDAVPAHLDGDSRAKFTELFREGQS